MMERLSEARPGRISIGTTSRGIGPCYEDKMGRRGIRFGDFVRFTCFDQAYESLRSERVEILKAFDLFDGLNDAGERDRYRGIAERLRPMVCDTAACLTTKSGPASGCSLKAPRAPCWTWTMGSYPFVTSSSSTAGGACIGSGVPPNKISGVIGICKAYITRVGGGPFPTELHDDVGEHIRKRGKEFGAVTGRPRRCGWFDVPLLRYSAMINGFDSLVITKLDVLDDLTEIPVCVEYQVDGESVQDMPPLSEDLGKVRPVLESLPGWNSSTFGISEYDELPAKAQKYLEYLEKMTGVEVGCISTGPERSQTIIRKGSRFEQLLG